MIDDNGWLNIKSNKVFSQKTYSPFFNKRPINTKINLIVVHCISLPEGSYALSDNCGIDRLFTNKLDPVSDKSYYSDLKELKVSAHIVIFRNGDIKQYVSFFDRAWHAGESSFNGVENCNDYSIGIELEGSVKDKTGYTKNQYKSLKELIIILKDYFLINNSTKECVTTHKFIAPSRKEDPGDYFDFSCLELD